MKIYNETPYLSRLAIFLTFLTKENRAGILLDFENQLRNNFSPDLPQTSKKYVSIYSEVKLTRDGKNQYYIKFASRLSDWKLKLNPDHHRY